MTSAPTTPDGVAAFDFDGTLVALDTMLGFLRRVAGLPALAAGLGRIAPLARGLRSHPEWRDVGKELLLQRLLEGVPLEVLESHGRAYGEVVGRRVTPHMHRLLDWHRRSGHGTVIVSASLEVYLAPAAERIGVDAVLGTRLEVGPDGRLTGRLEGPNCRGPEKARRLSAWMSAHGMRPGAVPVWAYGDSRGDDEMLALARVATRVRRGRPRTSPEGFTPDPVEAPSPSAGNR